MRKLKSSKDKKPSSSRSGRVVVSKEFQSLRATRALDSIVVPDDYLAGLRALVKRDKEGLIKLADK